MWLGLWHHTALYLDTDVSGGPAASSSRGNGGTRSSERAVPTHETARCSNRDDHNMVVRETKFRKVGPNVCGPLSVVLELLHAAGAYNFEVASIFLENLRFLAENRLSENTQKITAMNYGIILRTLCADEVRNGERRRCAVLWFGGAEIFVKCINKFALFSCC